MDELVKRLHRYTENCVAYKLDADFADAVQQAADAIEELICEVADEHNARLDAEERHRWIPVEERLPDFEGCLLCMRKAFVGDNLRYQDILYYDEDGFRMKFENTPIPAEAVTHWMPLPKPPKEE